MTSSVGSTIWWSMWALGNRPQLSSPIAPLLSLDPAAAHNPRLAEGPQLLFYARRLGISSNTGVIGKKLITVRIISPNFESEVPTS